MDDSSQRYEGNLELRQTENSLASYNNFIVNNIVASLQNTIDNPKILDFGAGIGTLATLLDKKINADIACFEIDEKQAAECESRGFESYTDLDNLKKAKFDLIYASNVLEHINDDYQTLVDLRLLLKDGGVIFIYVPANKFLWTDMDVKVGHVRRYSRKKLKSVVEAADFTIIKLRYVDFLGVFALLLVKFFGFNSNGGMGGRLSLTIYDRFIWPMSRFFDLLARFLIGKNLMIVARKN